MVDITEIVEGHLVSKLHCALCTNFLSVPPILIDTRGKDVCGRCKSDINAGSFLHNIYLEVLAKQFRFPCRFSHEGCSVKKVFGKIKLHEETCTYQTHKCGVATCGWSGIATELIIHNKKNHQDLIIENDSSERELSEGDGCFMFVTEGFYFLIEWTYCEFKFNLRVTNLHLLDLDADIIFNYSLSRLSPEEMFKTSGSLKLNSSVILILHDSNKKGLSVSTLLFSVHAILSANAINKKEEALNKIACPNCGCAMTPPILKCPVGHITCVDCTDTDYDVCEKCEEDELRFSRVHELEVLATSLLYKCKWKDCNEVFSFREIEFHQRTCLKRVYICLNCPYWKGLLKEMTTHTAVCTSLDYIGPIFFNTEITVLGTNINESELEYTLVAHKELFCVMFNPFGTGIKVTVNNCGPPSLFGWYRLEAVLHHTEDLNFPFNKTYSKSSNRFIVVVPNDATAKFGGREFYKITVRINLLMGSDRIRSVAEYFRWFK